MPWSRKSRHQRGYGTAWAQLRAEVLRDEPLCRPCFVKNRIVQATVVDHDVMKARGGTDDRSNLVPMCRVCHDAKSLRELGKTPKRRVDRHGNPLDRDDPWHMGGLSKR